MLLRCCLITYNNHYTETNFMFSIFGSMLCLSLGLFMSYFYDLFFIFSLIFIAINHITSLKWAHLFFIYFSEYFLFFLDNDVMKNVNNFQIAKVQPRVLLSICLIFCQFQLGVGCKIVAYVKSVY